MFIIFKIAVLSPAGLHVCILWKTNQNYLGNCLIRHEVLIVNKSPEERFMFRCSFEQKHGLMWVVRPDVGVFR